MRSQRISTSCMFLSIFLPPAAVTKWPNFHIKYNGSLFKRKSFMLDELTLQNVSKFTIFLGISKLRQFSFVFQGSLFFLNECPVCHPLVDGLWLLTMQFISENIKYNEKKKKHRFSFVITKVCMSKVAFHQNISSSINLLKF